MLYCNTMSVTPLFYSLEFKFNVVATNKISLRKAKLKRSHGIQNKFTWNCTWLDIMTTKTTICNCMVRGVVCTVHIERRKYFSCAPNAQIQRQFLRFIFSFSLCCLFSINIHFFYLIVVFTCHKWRSKHHSHRSAKILEITWNEIKISYGISTHLKSRRRLCMV